MDQGPIELPDAPPRSLFVRSPRRPGSATNISVQFLSDSGKQEATLSLLRTDGFHRARKEAQGTFRYDFIRAVANQKPSPAPFDP
jgi:hypothetical protein